MKYLFSHEEDKRQKFNSPDILIKALVAFLTIKCHKALKLAYNNGRSIIFMVKKKRKTFFLFCIYTSTNFKLDE